AVADAIGGAVEGWTPEQIEERHGGRITGIVPPFNSNWRTARPLAPYHKGDGHITDDTLMTIAVIETYERVRRHLTAYDVAAVLSPIMLHEPRWIPELETETVLMNRVFFAEKWIVGRLHYGHVDPREAGVGNVVNCGAAMYMAPVGLTHPGNPHGAYAEAIDIAGAHQSSYGREAAGVFAAAVAAAVRPGSTIDDVLASALDVAHDGTRAAIAAVASAVAETPVPQDDDDARALAAAIRAAVAPYDSVGAEYRNMDADARRPSRTMSIEELPVALGLALAYRGQYWPAVLAAANYGRDSDSIAVMAGAVCAGLHGPGAVPQHVLAEVETASRTPLTEWAVRHADTVLELVAADAARLTAMAASLESVLSASPASPQGVE
nr:ADP-ribosylglycohydrolase family protein [Actinomycetales bacterium]